MFCLTNSIAQSAPSLQVLLEKTRNASSLPFIILAALQLGRAVAVQVVEEILNARGQAPDEGGTCPKCGKKLESNGLKKRQVLTLVGWVKWWRRVRGCPGGCKIGQVVPTDGALGLQPYQQTSLEVKWLTCALAVFVPFEIASVLLEMLTGVKVCSKSVWWWVQERGQIAMVQLDAQLEALTTGELPDEEALDATTKSLPLLIGGDGVMVPFRPEGGTPKGKTIWREVKVGVIARLGQRVTKTGKQVSQLTQRRLVAVLGSINDFGPRLWLEAVQQGILSSKTVVWLSDGGRGFPRGC